MNIKTTYSKIKKMKSYLKKQKANLALKLRESLPSRFLLKVQFKAYRNIFAP